MQPFTDSGTPLIAEFAVEAHDGQLSMTFESAGGRTKNGPRNRDYVPALVVLLGRLAQRSAVIVSAAVESKKTADLPLHKRLLTDGSIQLSPASDFDALRKRLTSAQGRIGQEEGAPKAGNNRKRMRLVLEVPGYGIADGPRLERDLAAPLLVDDLIASLKSLKVHNSGGKPAREPIALLWALGRLAAGEGRLFDWPEFDKEVGDLLRDFGASAAPRYPFWHLGSDSTLWERHNLAGPPTAADTDARAGFTEDAAALLANPVVRAESIYVLRTEHLSDLADQADLLDRVGLAGVAERAMIEIRTAFDSVTKATLPSLPPDTLDKMTAAVRRVEQAELRKLVVGTDDTAQCALCGDTFPLRYLVAAHIKPRSQCTDEERRDLRNVAMAACAFGCDMLFELGYITVDKDGWIRTAEAMPSGRFADHVTLVGTRRCSAHRPGTEPYFAWHRANRFVK
ncbi:HNH endonuclease [Actinokineospora xionganensis]|uniref:ScoMcrA-like DNA sulfur-binding domain-containing protein n=1 Tax=Actinokineospora xionganensis TaxID=2684470 RepID=A0ABR7L807_9PSEU|nr:HNH endonuclease [Actinokineospora xionganensis]MBC6448779.1 hypothetical protein [Actinokineospora xionganensis]